MAKKVRVNVLCTVNSADIRRETRHGREKIIVPSATMPDDVIMNGIKYPGDEIANSFETLNGTPAPLGHPSLDGQFLSASSTEAMIRNGIGAENENARQESGRVFVDKVIAAGSDHKYIARNLYFDHDAILLEETGAATPEQGVGLMVNSDGEEFEVINSSLQDDVDRELDWAADMAVRALEKQARIPLVEAMKSAFSGMFGPGRETSVNTGEDDMADDKKVDALSEKVDALSDTVGKVGETITNAMETALKPLVDAQKMANERAEAEEKAERDTLINKLIEAKVIANTEEAGETPIAILNKMLPDEDGKSGNAAALNSKFQPKPTGKRTFEPPKSEGK